MTIVYVNHDHPKVQNIDAACAILRRLREAAKQDSYRLSRKPERLKAAEGSMRLDNAMMHLAELIRVDAACWRS